MKTSENEQDIIQCPAIDPLGSEGFEINILFQDGKICGVEPRKGFVNTLNIINEDVKNYFAIFNRQDRIQTPLIRENRQWKSISEEDAIQLIHSKINDCQPNENVFFASPTLPNEYLYMIQRWARAGVMSNALNSFHHLKNETAFNLNKNDLLPIHEMIESQRIYIINSDLSTEHSIIHQLVQKARIENHTPVTMITQRIESVNPNEVEDTIGVKSTKSFFRAVNHYLLQKEYVFGIFTQGMALQYVPYKEALMSENFESLMAAAGIELNVIQKFVKEIITHPETAFIVSEKSCDKETFWELKNLMLLTEKQAKRNSGIMLLKKYCNSQGLYDMGFHPTLGPGNRSFDKDYIDQLCDEWNQSKISTDFVDVRKEMSDNKFKNYFIFGENPIAEYPEYQTAIQSGKFICVQTLFMNETAEKADLVLPQNFAIEIGGSYTTSFKVAQSFSPIVQSPISWNDYQFLGNLNLHLGLSKLTIPQDIFYEIISFFRSSCCEGIRHKYEWQNQFNN